MPADALLLNQLSEGSRRSLLQVVCVDREVSATETLKCVTPHNIIVELEDFRLVAVNTPSQPGPRHEVVANQGPEDGIDFGVVELVSVSHSESFCKVVAPTGSVQDKIASDFAELKGCKRMLGMDVIQQIEDSRMVAVSVLDKDGCADVEEVGLRREVVDAFGGDQALAQLAQSHQDK